MRAVHTHTHTHAHTRTHTGGVGLVYYSPHEEKLLNSSTLMAYVFSDVFFMYSGILILMLVLLMSIRKRWAREWVVVDLSLCAILGSWTVMATKGLSVSVRMTMLSEENAFTSWITYALLVVMLVTAVYQVHTHARTHARTHPHTHPRTHPPTHAQTHNARYCNVPGEVSGYGHAALRNVA